mgnify:FL=1
MAKKYLEKNVYEATQERIEYIFNEFDNVLVSFSGGKDSGVCLEMCYDYAKKHNMLDKLAMVHMDYEAQYQMTTDYVDETFKRFSDIRRYWLCLPIYAQCACRMDSGYWIPWEKSKKDIWVRDMPEYDYVINEDNCEFEIKKDDFEIPEGFFEWFRKKYGKTVSVVGIRTDESLNRFRAIASDKVRKYKGKKWINEDKAYIIYDWNVDDVWVYNYKFEKPYNKLYDLFYNAGLNVDQMRVASPFNDCGIHSLKLYKVIDPNNWGKMIGRVNGVNFAGLYGGTTAMGWKSITKPKHFTWKEYCYFLLDTLDEKTKQHYLEKLNTSIKVWKEKGCVVSDDTLKYLEDNNIQCEKKGRIKAHTDKEVVAFDEYLDDTDCPNFKELPTYKRMCICIIKNDYYCKYMGFAQTKNELSKRKDAINKYKNL